MVKVDRWTEQNEVPWMNKNKNVKQLLLMSPCCLMSLSNDGFAFFSSLRGLAYTTWLLSICV